MDFSDPYHEYSFAVVAKDAEINSHSDLAHKKIGVQLGSSHEAKVNELKEKLRKIRVTSLAKVPELVQGVEEGACGCCHC